MLSGLAILVGNIIKRAIMKKLLLKLVSKTGKKGNLLKIIGGVIAGGSGVALGMEPAAIIPAVEQAADPSTIESITHLIKEVGVLIGLVMALWGQFHTKEPIKE